MKNKRLSIIKVIILAVFVILSGFSVLAARDDLRYMIQEAVRFPNKDLLPQQLLERDINVKEYTFEELCNDGRVVFENSLLLINEEYTLPQNYSPKLVTYGDTKHKISSNALESFADLVTEVNKNCQEELLIVSGYRSADEQMNTIAEEGKKAASVNASEHLTGLSLDVCVQYFGGNAFLKSSTGRFVNARCGDYGFIIRYPLFSKNITGIEYEPWHIRYVGLPHSKILYGAKLTLEEYVEYLKIGEFYSFEDYIITRQLKGSLELPENFETALISEDNTGCYIITIKRN